MKTLGRLWLTVLAMIVAVSLSAASLAKPLPRQSEVKEPTDTYARYFFSAETVYRDIVILNRKIKITYFKDAGKRCAEWREQRPCWTAADLRSREARLTGAELRALRELVKQSEFLLLENLYGGASAGQRHYTETVKVSLGFVAKEVKYQSFPEAQPKPAAFVKVSDYLLKLAKRKFRV